MKQPADYFEGGLGSSTEHQLEHDLYVAIAIIPIIAPGLHD